MYIHVMKNPGANKCKVGWYISSFINNVHIPPTEKSRFDSIYGGVENGDNSGSCSNGNV